MKQFFIIFLLLSSCVGNTREEPDDIKLRVIWTKSTNNIGAPDTQPLVTNESKIIYTGEIDLVALDINTGNELWRGSIDEEQALISGILLEDQHRKRILSNHRKNFKAWDAETGESIFTLNEETGVQAFVLGKHAVSYDRYAIVGDTLDAYVTDSSGKILYTIQVSFASSGLAFNDNKIYMSMGKTIHGALTKGKIIAFDVLDGDSLWGYNTDNGGFINTAPIIENGILYAGAFGNSPINEVVALDAETGEVIWKYESDYIYTRNAALGPLHYYVNTGGSLAALDKQIGERSGT